MSYYKKALEFAQRSPGSERGCVETLNVVIAGLESIYGECAEAHYELECVQCQSSVIIRKLREDRDDFMVGDACDRGATAEYADRLREQLKRKREKHEENLVNSSANYMSEQECLDAIEAASTHYGIEVKL